MFRCRIPRRTFLYGSSAALLGLNAVAKTLSSDSVRASRAPVSRIPLDVVLDYNYKNGHLDNGAGRPFYSDNQEYWAAFRRELRNSPPDVLVVGKEAPFTHSMGPIAAYGGENQTFPPIGGKDSRYRLSPEQLRQKIAAIRRFVDEVHQAGVPKVAPYVSLVTMYGDPEKRNGFWEFLDHWDDYAREFELGPRPEGDPIDWMQRTEKGEIGYWPFDHKPHYEPFRRYMMCINAPGWRTWCQAFTKWIAEVGYDGLWIDNAALQQCHCRHCQSEASRRAIKLSPVYDKMWTKRSNSFWVECHARFWDELRRQAAALRPAFGIFVNYGELPYQQLVSDHADVTMIEHQWLGLPRVAWPDGIWSGYYAQVPETKTQAAGGGPMLHENTWIYGLSFAMRGAKGIHWLSATGGKGIDNNESSALLALSEAAAFGGGCTAKVVGPNPFSESNNEAANRIRNVFFRQFLPRSRHLYEGLRPAGEIGIVVFPDQDPTGLLEAQEVYQALVWKGFLFDVVNGSNATVETLRRYRLLVLPGDPGIPDWMKGMSFLKSPAPLTSTDLDKLTAEFQEGARLRKIRDTGLAAAVLKRLRPGDRVFQPVPDNAVACCAWENERIKVLHLVNHRVPLGAKARLFPPAGPLDIRLPVAKGRSISEIKIWSPTRRDVVRPSFKPTIDGVAFQSPSIDVYEVCEIAFSS